MKGFGIYVKNDLLEPKHHDQMGIALWLYLWLLDKMTSISESGVGKVLGGKPVRYEEVLSDLGISRRSYSRYIKTLQETGYIDTKRTPYGVIFEVHKAVKPFKKRSARSGTSNKPEVAHLRDKSGASVGESGTSNKTIQLDNTVDNTIARPATPAYEEMDKTITDMLFTKIQHNFSELGVKRTRKPPTIKDYVEMNRLHRIDGYSYDEIKTVINWALNDSFWKLNILSVRKLRQQFEQLLIKMQAGRFKSPPPDPKDNPNYLPERRSKNDGLSAIGEMLKGRPVL